MGYQVPDATQSNSFQMGPCFDRQVRVAWISDKSKTQFRLNVEYSYAREIETRVSSDSSYRPSVANLELPLTGESGWEHPKFLAHCHPDIFSNVDSNDLGRNVLLQNTSAIVEYIVERYDLISPACLGAV